MPGLSVNLIGIRATEKNLVVSFTVGEVRARRVHEIRVPLTLLLAEEIRDRLFKAEARRLKAYWEGEPDPTLAPWD